MDTKEKKPQRKPSGKKPVRSAPSKPRAEGRGAKQASAAAKPTAGKTPEKRRSTEPAVRRNPKPVQEKKAETKRRQPAKTKPAAPPKPTPDIVYTPAKPFNRNRLLLRLTTVVAVVLAFTFGISIFFKVDSVKVAGNEKYSVRTVELASGIEKGDNLLTFGKAKASGKIMAALPYVESVRIGIKLPDTVNIEIKEVDAVYAIRDGGDNWWLMSSLGRVVEKVEAGIADDYMQIFGVELQTPVPAQQALAFEPQTQTDSTGESTEQPLVTVPITVTAADKLTAALSILQYLEKEELFDNVVSLDVSSLGNIQLWYGQQYKVMLGDTSQLGYKIHLLNGAINGENGLKEYDSGILDITFTTSQGESVIYEPFD